MILRKSCPLLFLKKRGLDCDQSDLSLYLSRRAKTSMSIVRRIPSTVSSVVLSSSCGGARESCCDDGVGGDGASVAVPVWSSWPNPDLGRTRVGSGGATVGVGQTQ